MLFVNFYSKTVCRMGLKLLLVHYTVCFHPNGDCQVHKDMDARREWDRQYRRRPDVMEKARIRRRKKYKSNPEKYKAQALRARKRMSAEKRKAISERERLRRDTTGERIKKSDKYLRDAYGMTLEERNEILKAQDGRCAICLTDSPNGRHRDFHVDHVRGTKIVRGLLCHSCNMGIGYFKDSIWRLERAITYLEPHPAPSGPLGRIKNKKGKEPDAQISGQEWVVS
jgi:hypothetical protein